METRTIPEEHWVEFFDRFSQDHVGWPATIEVEDLERGPQKVASGLPFIGISFDTRGTRPSSVEVIAGSAPAGGHVEHVIDRPLYIRKAQGNSGDIDLQIEPAVGPGDADSPAGAAALTLSLKGPRKLLDVEVPR